MGETQQGGGARGRRDAEDWERPREAVLYPGLCSRN